MVLDRFHDEFRHCGISRGSVHRFTLAGRATDGASWNLKMYVGDYSIPFPFDAPGEPGASPCLLGRSREVFFLFFSFCVIIHREIGYVEETHAAFDLPFFNCRADPHGGDAAVGAKAEATRQCPV